MPDPAPTRRESSKPVPVGEPPTPEGWPKTIWFCEQCGEQPGAVNLPCACVDWGKRIKVQAFRVAPVGGAGQEEDELRYWSILCVYAEALDAISEGREWCGYAQPADIADAALDPNINPKPGPPAGGGGTGDRHLREALEWIEGFAIAGRDAEWDRVAGVARVALASVGEEDAVAEARGGSRWTEADYERAAEAMANMDGARGNAAQPGHRDAARAALDAVVPVGEPDDERLVNTIRGPLEAQGLPTDDEGWAKLVRWVVAAVRAAGPGGRELEEVIGRAQNRFEEITTCTNEHPCEACMEVAAEGLDDLQRAVGGQEKPE